MPRTRPSLRTGARTWRREAPSVRSSANSRMRWAIVIEKVLKMMKAPTNSEIPAKTSSAVLRKPRSSLISSDWRARLLLARAHDRLAPDRGAQRRAPAASGDVPGAGGDLDRREAPGHAEQALGDGQLDLDERRAAERVDAAERREADEPERRRPRSPCTTIVSPSSRSLRSAVALSIAASSGRARQPALLGLAGLEARTGESDARSSASSSRPGGRRRVEGHGLVLDAAPALCDTSARGARARAARRAAWQRAAVVVLQALARRDRRVDALVGLGEDPVERRLIVSVKT